MPAKRIISMVALFVLLFQTTGCYKWVPFEGGIPAPPSDGTPPPRFLIHSEGRGAPRVRIHTTDGQVFQRTYGWIDPLEVGGELPGGEEWNQDTNPKSFPLPTVTLIETRKFSLVRTALLVSAIPAALIGAFAATFELRGGLSAGFLEGHE